MSITRDFTKTVLIEKIGVELSTAFPLKYNGLQYDSETSHLKLEFSEDLTLQEDTDLTNLVNNHVPTPTTHTTIMRYLNGDVESFINDLLNDEAASNMLQGITQLGKTSHVLGLMCKKYDIDSTGFPISLSDTLKFKSLYESIKVIQHIRDNPTEYSNLSPFVTDARLLSMKNKMEQFLGVALTA